MYTNNEVEETQIDSQKSGYIYILMNPSMDNLVKIGRTSRDPVNRIKELSQATGVPTPFILVYKEYFLDCYVAESVIHNLLEKNGYKISNNREFFSIPIYDSIKLLQKIKEDVHVNDSNIQMIDEIFPSKTSADNSIAESYYEKGNEYYYGSDNELEDYEEATNLYKKASDLGHAMATVMLGIMCVHGEGCKKNYKKALRYYQKSLKQGNLDAYYYMAEIFGNIQFESMNNITNAEKCWRNFFKKNNFDILEKNFSRSKIGDRLESYINFIRNHNMQLDYLDILLNYKNEIFDAIEFKITIAEDGGHDFYKSDLLERVEFIRQYI